MQAFRCVRQLVTIVVRSRRSANTEDSNCSRHMVAHFHFEVLNWKTCNIVSAQLVLLHSDSQLIKKIYRNIARTPKKHKIELKSEVDSSVAPTQSFLIFAASQRQ